MTISTNLNGNIILNGFLITLILGAKFRLTKHNTCRVISKKEDSEEKIFNIKYYEDWQLMLFLLCSQFTSVNGRKRRCFSWFR